MYHKYRCVLFKDSLFEHDLDIKADELNYTVTLALSKPVVLTQHISNET